MACREQALSNNYLELLVDYPLTEAETEGREACVEVIDDQFVILYLPRQGLAPLSVSDFTYNSIPKLYGLKAGTGGSPGGTFEPLSLIRSGILQTQREPLSLTGKGVILGFVDTGIRYNLDVFRKEDGTSRILSIWDQTIQDGVPPEGFSYGTEYTREEINEALFSENPLSVVPSTDTIGHGTMLASAAAGSSLRNGLEFLGAAPDADIVMVKCKEGKQYLKDYYFIPEGVPAYSDADIGSAVKYLEGLARVGERPVVICIGMESNWGDHAGNSVLARYLSRVAEKRNRVVIISAGNEGNAAHHFLSFFEMTVPQLRETAEVRVDGQEKGFLMELWGSVPNVLSVSIRSPGGERIPTVDLRTRGTQEYSFIYEQTRITVDHVLVEQGSGEELVVFRFVRPTPGVWSFEIVSESDADYGTINMWLPIRSFMEAETYFLRSSPYITLTEPSSAGSAITPSAYNDSNNSFYPDSGRGFLRDGDVKPDFSAPGVNVSTVLGKQTDAAIAAALCAGAAAQFMEWAVIEGNDVLAQSVEVKAYFIRGAVRTAEEFYPNRSWGFGRLNLAGVFEILAGIGRTEG